MLYNLERNHDFAMLHVYVVVENFNSGKNYLNLIFNFIIYK